MRVIAAILLFAAASLPARAEVDGEIRLGATQGGALSGAAVFADGTWSYQRGRFGVALGAYGVWTQDDQPHETYAALTFDGARGRLSFGVPRPAYDLFAVSVIDHALPALGLASVAQTRSHATANGHGGRWHSHWSELCR